MDLVRPTDIPHHWIERSIGTSRTQCVLAFLLSVASGYLAYCFGVLELRALHWGFQIVAAPFLLLGALLWFVVTHALCLGMLGAFRSGNWVLKVGADHVFLNLRCYSNFDLCDDGATVARIHYREIESAGRVRESFELEISEAARVCSYLEVRLHHTETDDLRAAVRAEAEMEGPTRNFGLFTMKSRSTMRSVVVTAPGVIRVVWRGRQMLRALARVTQIVAPRDHALASPSSGGAHQNADDQILELVERGDHIAAIELVREAYSMSLTEADQFLFELGARTDSEREAVDALGTSP